MSDFSAKDDKRLRELATVFRRAHIETATGMVRPGPRECLWTFC